MRNSIAAAALCQPPLDEFDPAPVVVDHRVTLTHGRWEGRPFVRIDHHAPTQHGPGRRGSATTTDTASIQAKLEGLHNLPTPVRAWRVEEGLDATDDPAVWIWALMDQSEAEADTLRQPRAMARDVVCDVVRDGTDLWAYVLVRGADEVEVSA